MISRIRRRNPLRRWGRQIVSVGLMIGTEFAVSAFVNPILTELPDAAEGQATRLFARKLGFVMPFWYGFNLLLLIGELVMRRHETGVSLVAAASAMWASIIVLTIVFLVPINNRVANMTSDRFTDAFRREHSRWDLLHRWRVQGLGAAMICFLIGIHV